ncbi:alkaline phosphatase D family protein [Haloferula sp.]|uniref:alkaline phosphatase D family protein n=1 Tax=Haloferula sp. TaxID=2497595 RepID=UPI00329A943F
MKLQFLTAALVFSVAVSLSAGESPWQPLPDGSIQRIAFGSCAKHWQAQPIWEGIIAAKPDMFLFLGDNIYADTDGRTAWQVSKGQLTGEWNRLADKPEFQKARAAMPFMATWDNHDYGSHAGGAEHPVKTEAKECFLTFFGEPKDSSRWKRSGIYDAKILGPEGKRVQIILLDTKFNRSAFKKDSTPKDDRLKAGKVGGYLPDDDPAKTHLGAEQWAWLEEELKKPAELRLVCSSTQVIPNQKGMDEWGNFPRERQRLLDLLGETNGVVLLSGNVHFAEISQVTDGAYPLTELTSSGMTHIEEIYGKAPNKFRLGEPLIDLNFGLVEIDWAAGTVTLKAVDEEGSDQVSRTLSMEVLRPKP